MLDMDIEMVAAFAAFVLGVSPSSVTVINVTEEGCIVEWGNLGLRQFIAR
jgi:hypothetical protein